MLRSNKYIIMFVFFVSLIIVSCTNFGERVDNNEGEVYYKEPITKLQAENLAEYLKTIGYFEGHEKSVQLLKDGDKYTVNFAVKDGEAEKKENVEMFKNLSPYFSYDVFDGALVNIGLCDDKFNTVKFIPGFNYGKLMEFGDDNLYYTKEISNVTAQNLGNFLREAGFFQSKGLQAQITKKGDIYQFRYVVKEGMEQDESYKATVRAFGVMISGAVFDNQRVDMHLCDDNFKTLATVIAK